MEGILGYIQSKPLFYIISTFILSTNFLFIILLGLTIYYIINIANQYVENSRKIKIGNKHLFVLGIIIVIVIFISIIYHFKDLLKLVLNPIIWAIIFSYLLNPMVHFFERQGISRFWSVVLLYSIIIALILFISIAITPKIVKEVKNFVDILPKYTTEANNFINGFYEKIQRLDNFSPQMSIITNTLQENLVAIQYGIIEFFEGFTKRIFNIFSNIVSIALVPIYSFYFLKDTVSLRKKISLLIPKSIRPELIQVFRDINKTLSKFIRGQILVAICVGILSTLALLILNVDFAFLIGLIACISNLIPYVGPIMGAIPAVMVALLDQPMKAIWVIIAFTIIQQIESAVISPKIVGDSVGLHPVIIILALIVGNETYGIIGMLFGIPIVASLKVIMWHITNYIIKAH